jgi:Na+-driven multidrug efflux pump
VSLCLSKQAFLYTGATNLVAAAQEKDRSLEGKPKTTSSFTTALQLSTYVGAALGTILFVFARQLLGTLIGNEGISPEVFNAALKYVRIRALGMPGAAIIGSAQAGCLGMQDIKSPLYVLAAAALINLFGDMFFVGLSNPLIGGAAGAAWATVFSQYAAVAFFMRWLCTKPKAKEPTKVLNLTNNILELTGEENSKGAGRRHRFNDAVKSFAKSTPAYLPVKSLASKVACVTQKLRKSPKKTDGVVAKKEEEVTSRGLLAGKFTSRDLLSFPDKARAEEYAPYLLPVTTTQVGRVSSYVAMSHVVSSTLGTASMAAQQVIVSLFYCLTPIADSLSLTAQSVVPSLVEKKQSKGRAMALRNTMVNFFKAGGIFSAAMVSAVLCIPFLSRLFTTDPGVRALVNSVAPLLIGFFSVHGVFMASEGLLLAQKDLNFIGKAYGAFFFAVPYFMLRVKKAALAGTPGINLTSVWSVFVLYQFVRFAAFMVRNIQMQRRNDRDGAKAEASMLF